MTNDMTKGSPMKLLLNFMIPVLLGNLFQTFYNLVDTMIVGHFVGMTALAAVGSTGSIMFCVQGMVMGLTSGFGVIMAQSFGGGKEGELRNYFAVSVYLSLLITVLATAGLLIFRDPLLHLMNTPEDIYREAAGYIQIIYWGLIAMMAYNLLAAALRSVGDSRTPLYFLILSSILNIGLDWLFVVPLEMGVEGAAYATVVSQGVSAVLCLFYMWSRYEILRVKRREAAFTLTAAKRLLGIGVPMALQFSITAFGIMIVQSALNILGSVSIAAYTAAQKIVTLVQQPGFSLGTTVATYVGQNAGAGEKDRIREGIRCSCIISTVSFSVCMVLCLTGGEYAGRLFLSDPVPEMVEQIREYFHIASWFYVPLGLIFVYRNALQGLGDGFFPMLGGVFELAARGLVILLVGTSLGFAGICFADPVAWMAALLPLIPVYYYRIRRYRG